MSDASRVDPQMEVRNLLMGFVVSRALQVAAELGLADALADGPKDRDALAREVGAHADTLHRVVRALASFGVFNELPDGRLANTPLSEYLRSDAPASLRGLARMHGGSPSGKPGRGSNTAFVPASRASPTFMDPRCSSI